MDLLGEGILGPSARESQEEEGYKSEEPDAGWCGGDAPGVRRGWVKGAAGYVSVLFRVI